MISRKLSRQVYWLVTIIITLQFVLMVGVIISQSRETLNQAKERELVQIATILEQEFPYQTYEAMKSDAFVSLPYERKILYLNQHLQPIINHISQQWPGYGLGFYVQGVNIAALAPYDPRLLGHQASPEALQVYRTKKMTVSYIQDGLTLGGTRIIAANYPLKVDGNIIGHVWANAKTNDVDSIFYREILITIASSLLAWLLIINIIRWAMRRSNRNLHEVINQINDGKNEPQRLQAVPELIPILATVQSLKEHIASEYAAKQQVQADLARLDRLNTVGEMAAAVAHEIRNPMTVVMGYAQIAAQSADETTRETFDIIREELKNINQIIEDFLAISRDKPLNLSKQSLNAILENIYPLIYAESVSRNIDIDFQLAKELPPVMIDSKEIRQLVLNLTRNALEAMDSKGTLTISTTFIPEEGCVLLSIKDTGTGISPEVQSQIFNPFYTTKENGTGLGLSVCKNITERHQGNIEIESSPETGTTFHIKFPMFT